MTEPTLPSPFVVALVTTYRRAVLLERLLVSFREIRTPLAILVVDNADDPATGAAVDQARAGGLEITRLVPGANLGCGGALEYGEREALARYPRLTHFWALDDDAVVEPGALERLLAVMADRGAQIVCPAVLNDQRLIHWFPGVINRAVFDTIRKSLCSPEAYRAQWGTQPQPIRWSPGIALLYTREAVEQLGFHRGDFWLRGEDIEFCLRITHRHLGLFVPDALVSHLPPPDPGGPESRRSERTKHWWMVRNSAYISLRLPHGRRILRSLPGNLWRYVKANGPLGLWGAFTALLQGALGNLGPIPPAPAGSLNLIAALSDLDFDKTKSLGILNVATSLAETLAAHPRVNRITVLGNSTLHLALPPRPKRIIDFNHVIGSRLVRLLWSQWGVYAEAKAAPSDWLLLPKGYAPLFKKPPCRLAAYVHDTMLDHYAEHYPGRMPFFESLYLRLALRATLTYADIIFTNSEFTRGQVLKLAEALEIPPPPIVTAGIGFSEPPAPAASKKNQILFLASKWPHKLTEQALKFADRWQRETGYDGEILWVGSIPREAFRPEHPNWKYHARLPEAPYREIFRESRAVVFFSEYEGFGMPPVEAAIAGSAPVYSDIPAVSESMRGIGFPFENGDYKSFAQALQNGLNSSGVVLEQWGRTLVNTHNWTKVAGTIIQSLEKISNVARDLPEANAQPPSVEAQAAPASLPAPESSPDIPRYRVLQIFNRYLQYGGEEGSVYRIGEALNEYHDVEYYLQSTSGLLGEGRFTEKLRAMYSMMHNGRAVNDVRRMQEIGQFHLWQIHNIFPTLSPSVYKEAFRLGVPILHYLHNYRLGCINGFFLDHGQMCQRCIKGNFIHAVKAKCWHDSGLACGWMALVMSRIKMMDLFHNVCRWVAISEAQKQVHVEMGIPADRIDVVHHFYEPSGPAEPVPQDGYAFFLGRLSEEKGCLDLLKAWKMMPGNRKLVIAGDGPELPRMRHYASEHGLRHVEFLGFVPKDKQAELWRGAAFLVVPSVWLEPFGMVVLEAWARGRTAIAYSMGALPEIITHESTGLLVEPFNTGALAAAMERLFCDGDLLRALSANARQELETRFSQKVWLRKINAVYEKVLTPWNHEQPQKTSHRPLV